MTFTDKSKKILCICLGIIAAVLLNCLLNWLVTMVWKIPLLFMDTVGTIAVTFAFGGIPGIICAVLSQLALGIMNHYFSWVAYFYSLAVWGAVGIVCIFRPKLNKSKTVFSVIVILALISLAMAFSVSILSGIINTINTIYSTSHNLNPDASPQTQQLQTDMIRMGFSQLPSNILSRIPGNLIERPVTTFIAYGICAGCRRIFIKKDKTSEEV